MPHPGLFRLLAALLLAFALVSFPAPPARAATIGVTTSADELNADGDCSLREAIRAANLNAAVDACPAGSGADTIVLPAGVYTLAIAGSNEDAALSGDLDITESLTITGALSTTTIIDGGALDNVLDIVGGNLTIAGLTLRNGKSRGIHHKNSGALTVIDSTISNNGSAGIFNSGTLTISQSLFVGNASSGVQNIGTALIDNSTFTHNQAWGAGGTEGGGIENLGTMLLTNSAVISNTAGRGGGIANGGVLTVTNSLINDNLALALPGDFSTTTASGGGIFSSGLPGSRLIVEHSVISGNQATFHGGGLYNVTEAHIYNTTIADNTVVGISTPGFGDGGGIENDDNGAMTLVDSMLRHNSSARHGGGIMAFGSVNIDRTTIVSNTANFGGGGIIGADLLTITHSIISYNQAASGGGIYNTRGWKAWLGLSGSTVSHNTAVLGGGIHNISFLDVTNSAIISNTATEDGGGIQGFGYGSSTSVLTVTNTTISGNSAGRDGGGIHNITSTLSLYNATITNNIADADADGTGDGGGILHASGAVALQNSILGGNAGQGGQANDCAGALLSQGYNLIQDTSGCTITGTTTTDIAGQPPLLGPLADNGGPTFTHALLPDSPALDAADPAGCRDAQGIPLTTDQRGAARPQGSACDIGAFESALRARSPTATRLHSSNNPSVVGQEIILIAMVEPPISPRTGSMTFKDGAAILGTSPVDDSGLATFTTATLAAGSHTITAEYSGNTHFRSSVSSPLIQQVDQLTTTVALDGSPNPSAFGQTVTFTATLHPASVTPTGTVTFKNGATVLGTSTLTSSGQASFSTALLEVGSHSISAQYSGDPSFSGAASPALQHQVGKAGATIGVIVSTQSSSLGQTVVFTVTVAANTSGTPTGTITLKDGAAVLGSGALAGGQWTFSTATLAIGQHTITAEYSGDAHFNAASSPGTNHTVLRHIYLPLIASP